MGQRRRHRHDERRAVVPGRVEGWRHGHGSPRRPLNPGDHRQAGSGRWRGRPRVGSLAPGRQRAVARRRWGGSGRASGSWRLAGARHAGALRAPPTRRPWRRRQTPLQRRAVDSQYARRQGAAIRSAGSRGSPQVPPGARGAVTARLGRYVRNPAGRSVRLPAP